MPKACGKAAPFLALILKGQGTWPEIRARPALGRSRYILMYPRFPTHPHPYASFVSSEGSHCFPFGITRAS